MHYGSTDRTEVSERSILHRSRNAHRHSIVLKNSAVPSRNNAVLFFSYEESLAFYPIQKSGIRLFSADVVPIQTAARRYLVLRLSPLTVAKVGS